MKTYFKIACPGCREILPIRAELFGKPVACKRCKHAFVADAKKVIGEGAVAPVPAAPDPEIGTLRQRVAQLEGELQQARDEAAARSADHAAALKTSADLEQQLQAHRSGADETAATNRTETEARRQELAESRAEAEWLRSLVADLQDGEGRAAEKEAHFQERLAAAEAQAQELDAVRAERDRLRAEVEQASAAHEQMHGEWEQKFESHGRAADEQLWQEQERNKKLQAELDLARSQIDLKVASNAAGEEFEGAQAEARRQELAAAQADAAKLRQDVAELQNQITRLAEADVRVRNELAAALKRSQDFDAIRAERDELAARSKQTPAEHAQHHDWEGNVMQKALEGVSPKSSWPYFDAARTEEPARPTAVAAPTPANAEPVPEQIDAARKEFARERANLQNEVGRLRKENGVLRGYLQNFGVQMIEM